MNDKIYIHIVGKQTDAPCPKQINVNAEARLNQKPGIVSMDSECLIDVGHVKSTTFGKTQDK